MRPSSSAAFHSLPLAHCMSRGTILLFSWLFFFHATPQCRLLTDEQLLYLTIATLLYVGIRTRLPPIHSWSINKLARSWRVCFWMYVDCRCTTHISHVKSVSSSPLPIISHGPPGGAVPIVRLPCALSRRRYHRCMRMEYVQYSHAHQSASCAIHLNNSTKHLLDDDSC